MNLNTINSLKIKQETKSLNNVIFSDYLDFINNLDAESNEDKVYKTAIIIKRTQNTVRTRGCNGVFIMSKVNEKKSDKLLNIS